MNPHYPAVALRAGHRCEYIVPLIRQGADADHNLALSCRACNLRKATYLDHQDPLTGEVVRLFHPRRDDWMEHFRVDEETGTLEGRTSIGRATVKRLDMNSSTQRDARRLWLRLGLFP